MKISIVIALLIFITILHCISIILQHYQMKFLDTSIHRTNGVYSWINVSGHYFRRFKKFTSHRKILELLILICIVLVILILFMF